MDASCRCCHDAFIVCSGWGMAQDTRRKHAWPIRSAAAYAYRHDLVDISRQALSNRSRELLPRIKEAVSQKRVAAGPEGDPWLLAAEAARRLGICPRLRDAAAGHPPRDPRQTGWP